MNRSPSRRAGLDPDKELSYRQQAANLLQDMGQRLNVYPAALGRAALRLGAAAAAAGVGPARERGERGPAAGRVRARVRGGLGLARGAGRAGAGCGEG